MAPTAKSGRLSLFTRLYYTRRIMSEKLTDYTDASGRGLIADPAMAPLRRYIPVLAVIAAPYAGLGGEGDPLNPLDPGSEWHFLLEMLAGMQRAEGSAPLAVVRLVPPTSAHLAECLHRGGPDAFQVIHFASHGERDMLYLEDENGHEFYAVAEHITNLFKNSELLKNNGPLFLSGPRLVVMDGCFSRRMGQMVIDGAAVDAVIGTRRRVNEKNNLAFWSHFYALISAGTSYRGAFRAALETLEPGLAERFELVVRGDRDDIGLPLPPVSQRAPRPLIDNGLPRQMAVPQHSGFVGRREMLSLLAKDFPLPDHSATLIHSAAGTGKSWLAAQIAERFSWHFPGGTLWYRAVAQTTTREVFAAAARLVDLPPDSEFVLAEIAARRALVIIDQIDMMAPAELESLTAWISQLDPHAGGQFLITSRTLLEPLRRIENSRAYLVEPFSYKSARTLAMKLAVERGVELLDVDTIDDFLEGTLNLPWLVARGVDLVEAEGINAALQDLSALKMGTADPISTFLARRVQPLLMQADGPISLLTRSQALSDAFSALMAKALCGDQTASYLDHLQRAGLLHRDGTLYEVPPAVSALVRQRRPLSAVDSSQTDVVILGALQRTALPADEPRLLSRDEMAWLNNVRSVVRRQLGPESTLDRGLVARVLAAAAPTFRMAGLADEFLGYTEALRELLPEGRDLARLQVAVGETLATIPDKRTEAGYTLQVARTIKPTDVGTLVDAARAYGRLLAQNGQVSASADTMAGVASALAAVPSPDPLLVARLAHDAGRALVADGRLADAVPRFETALSGYAAARRADLAAEVGRDLGDTLARLQQIDRAEDVLRRALATADLLRQHTVAGELRTGLGKVLASRALSAGGSLSDMVLAEGLIYEALADLLPAVDPTPLAKAYLDLARVQASNRKLAEAAENARRAVRLLERARIQPELAGAAIALGQIYMAQGNSVEAQAALHQALDVAAAQNDGKRMLQAARFLVNVHEIRARHARRADRTFRRNTLDQATFTRAVFVGLGLDEQATALDGMIRGLIGK